MNETIKKVQGFSKAMFIVAKIVSILCIIGLCASFLIALAWSLYNGNLVAASASGIIQFTSTNAHNDAEFWGSITYAFASIIFTLSIARIGMRLFGNMRSEATPFTVENAALWRKMGIVMVVAAIVPSIIGFGVGSAIAVRTGLDYAAEKNNGFSLIAALSFFAMSVIFKYGCELQTQVDETL